MRFLTIIGFVSFLFVSCGERKEAGQKIVQDSVYAKKGSFAYDLAFLQRYKNVIVLGEGASQARVLIIKDYQGRVMTSTAQGDQGNSFGWINYSLIESGANLAHFNPVGGEDRLWVGPEGGQFSVFFKKGQPFDFNSWQTPALVDTDTFDLVSVSSTQATFRKAASLTNYSGFTFTFDILRQVDLLNDEAIEKIFGISTHDLHAVGYQSTNAIMNTSDESWSTKTGLISIWILGMFTPSDKTTIVLPHERSPGADKKITDNYFGNIPSERIVKTDNVLMLKADGKFRGKVGIAPSVAKPIAGSYNAEKHILTLVKFDVEKDASYVNSKWEIQRLPFSGDVVNAYNDGPLADGKQLGPFFEIESSSPAKALKPRETLTHRHITIHLEGDEHLLNDIAIKTLGVGLGEIETAFKE